MSSAYQPAFCELVLNGPGGWELSEGSSCQCDFSLCAIFNQDERPVTIQDTWRLIHRGLGHTTRISQSVIIVEDFETIDAGYYICTAQNLRGQTTVATTVEFS